MFDVTKIIQRIIYCYNSIVLNYKSWFLILLALFLIDKNIVNSFVSFFIMLVFAHIAHYCYHNDSFYPLNVAHLYHHNHNNMFSHTIQILLEFVSLLFIVFFKYLTLFQYNVNILPFISDWTIVMFYFFYTTIHNINYSIFHVNRIHEMHHQTYVYNIGPDIADIIFGTKLNPDTDLENTDHYIYNIIGSTILVLFFKFIFNKLSVLNYMFFIIYLIGLLILTYYSIELFIQDIDNYMKQDLTNFMGI